jgi:hypothetical protein
MTENGDLREIAVAERINGILKTEWLYLQAEFLAGNRRLSAFAVPCKAMAGLKRKCQVYSGQSKKICKVFLGRDRLKCKVQVYLYIDTCTLHLI